MAYTIKNTLTRVLLLLSLSPLSTVQAAEVLDLDTVLQRIVKHYPTLRIAALQVDRARQDVTAAQAQLSWNLGANGGYSHDVTIFGTGIADTNSMGINLSKQLSSGSSLSFNSNYSDVTYDPPTASLPGTAVDFEVSYRMPFGKGSGNPAYLQALEGAKAGVMIAEANERGTRDQVTGQVVELYYATLATQERRVNAEAALKRAEALLRHFNNNKRLGLAEDKDILQFDSQLRAARLDLQGIDVLWQNQRTALNRLMGQPWQNDFTLRVKLPAAINLDPQQHQARVEQYSPELLRYQAQRQAAEAAIIKADNDRSSQFDLILSAGNKTRDTTSGNSGAVKFEYRLPLDKSGFDAKLYQANLDRMMAADNLAQSRRDLDYNLNGLLSEIASSQRALELARNRLQAERDRYSETSQRYKIGRADNSQLILAEGDLAMSEFTVRQQEIELAKRVAKLELLRGALVTQNADLSVKE